MFTPSPNYRPTLVVDTSIRCNYRCRMCYWSKPSEASKLLEEDRLMPMELFRLVLEQVLPHCTTIGLAGGGEFLVDPLVEHRLPLLNEALRRNPQVIYYQTTNGSLLTAERLQFLKGLKRAGFIISIDSVDALTYASIRRPGNLPNVMKNIRNLRSNLSNLGLEDIRIQLNVVLMKRNLFSVPDVVRLASEVQAAVFLEHPQGFGPEDIREESLFNVPALSNAFLARLEELATALHVPLLKPPPFAVLPGEVEAYHAAKQSRQLSCDQLDRSGPIQVLANGNVAVCCQGLVFGNLQQQSFEEILSSPKYVEYRQAIASGRPLSPCDHCRHLYREAPYLYESSVYDLDIPPESRNLDPRPDLEAEGFFDWLDELSEAQLRRHLRMDYLARSLKAALEPMTEVETVRRDREFNEKVSSWIRDGARLMLHPAGGQADWLMKHTLLPHAGVVGFSDRNPALHGTTFHGLPVVAPAEIPSLKPDFLVVVSERFQGQILRDLGHLEAQGIRLATLPDLLGKG